MVCSLLRVHGAHFLGAGGANRVLIISLIFCALQRHLRGAGWGGLGRGHLDNVAIKARVLKIDLTGPVNHRSAPGFRSALFWAKKHDVTAVSALKLGAFGAGHCWALMLTVAARLMRKFLFLGYV